MGDSADEPLDHWAARRQQHLRPIGERKAVSLGAGPHQGAHVDPQARRMVVEWDGFQWIPVTVVENYAAACRMLNPVPEPTKTEERSATWSPMTPGTGRHRKP
ncbi:hypothetical protein GCM10010211_63980 [Streptomyces albospinus]|uniref:Uncharacterized protein n=1 Tax=Streptomyces albospinus TaxID=285515 RepID=A0ABQ2VIE1_9ACTN|nr:hypothetical protein GCM10010211_63980 [Streptomyces albospinus]